MYRTDNTMYIIDSHPKQRQSSITLVTPSFNSIVTGDGGLRTDSIINEVSSCLYTCTLITVKRNGLVI